MTPAMTSARPARRQERDCRKEAQIVRRYRQPPVRTCGQCARTFRSWRENGLCGRCTETGERRQRTRGAGPVDYAGAPGDDGSLHFMLTGQPRDGVFIATPVGSQLELVCDA